MTGSNGGIDTYTTYLLCAISERARFIVCLGWRASPVLLAWRRADVAALNRTARIDQIAKGDVRGPELEATGGRRYAVGDQVVMLTSDREARWVTSDRGAITGIDGGALTIGFGPKRTVTLADGGGRELAYVAMSRARHSTHVHAVADDLDQAREDLSRDWTTERRDRWIRDTDTPASEADQLRPYVARRPGEQVRHHQSAPEREDLTALLEDEIAHHEKVDAARRRLDAIQYRRPGPDRGLGIG